MHHLSGLPKVLLILAIILLSATACTLPDSNLSESQPPNQIETPEPRTTPTPTPQPELNVPRIKIRTGMDGAEFYNTATEEKFVPRGFNYIHFLPTERDVFEDRVMAVNLYDPNRVRQAFQHMSSAGYNTVRMFFDICSYGPDCFGKENGKGVNPGYLDNMVDLMHIAGEEGIYIIFTANAIPETGGYPQLFDSIFEKGHDGFEDWRNADWIHTAGVETKRKMWQDLMNGLAERDAPFETVLGWQLTNEFWYWGDVAPPFSLTEGMVTTANGKTYDMSSQEQKKLMAVEGLSYFIEEIVSEIKAVDPEGLTTMGFYASYFGPDRYIVTPELLQADPPLDFWDFHAYTDSGLEIPEQVESFGMLGYDKKPIIMGEFGSGHAFVPSAASALTKNVEWVADSCEFGFDGWLYWGYYPWPDEVDGKAWAPLEDNELIFSNMAPNRQPDPCVVPDEMDKTNVAYKKPVRASGFWREENNLPEYAVDGTQNAWNSGGGLPHWIEINLEEPTAIDRVAMNVSQWPPGVTNHQVTAQLDDGSTVILGTIKGFTTVDQFLSIDLPITLQDVRLVRITTTETPAWPAWTEVEVLSGEINGNACLGRVTSSLPVLADPFPDADKIGSLVAGNILYLDGFYTDDTETVWARSGGDSWTAAENLILEGDCDSASLAAEPQARLIPITWKVTVPKDSPAEVFMAGEFPGMDWPYWLSWTVVLNKTSATTHEITIPLPEGAEIKYLFNGQTWESVERTATCDSVPDRTLTVTEEATIEVTIEAWRDIDCGGE